jgi:hypothetical protein
VAAACDGACRVSTGAGGWGYLIRLADGRVIEQGGHHPATTNNRMEMTAALELLRALEGLELPADGLRVKTDSRYLLDGLTRWLSGWKRRGWRTAEGEPGEEPGPMGAAGAGRRRPACGVVRVGQGPQRRPRQRSRRPDRHRLGGWSAESADPAKCFGNQGVADPTGSAWDVAASPMG